jgi:phasin family protein
MYQAAEQFIALNQYHLDAAARAAGVALTSAERIVDLQLEAAKTALANTARSAKAFAKIKDLQQLAAMKDALAQPSIDNAVAFAKSVYEVAAAAQAEYGKLAEEQVAEFSKRMAGILDRMANPKKAV